MPKEGLTPSNAARQVLKLPPVCTMILKFREVKCFSQNQTTAKEAEPGLISSRRVYLIWRINIFILAAESFIKWELMKNQIHKKEESKAALAKLGEVDSGGEKGFTE